ncbi:hypothetical protein CHCC14527_0599 [Bacillus paralicheniformis]|nr:hypothetical protein CHCC14527_0599 [Bacillus paralicheniformis]
MAVISLIFPSWVIKQYEFSIYEESNGHINDLLRYFLFFAWTINYEVQIVLARLPFVLQRLLGVIFVAVLLWELTMIGLIFENN